MVLFIRLHNYWSMGTFTLCGFCRWLSPVACVCAIREKSLNNDIFRGDTWYIQLWIPYGIFIALFLMVKPDIFQNFDAWKIHWTHLNYSYFTVEDHDFLDSQRSIPMTFCLVKYTFIIKWSSSFPGPHHRSWTTTQNIVAELCSKPLLLDE